MVQFDRPGGARVLVREYIYAGDRLIASVGLEPKVPPAVTWTDQPLQAGVSSAPSSEPTVTRYYHLDALGSVRAVTDPSGATVRRHDYGAFGEAVTPLAGVDARRFTGKERDAETGLDYFAARYYGAAAGRFTTVDPYRIVSEAEDEADLIAYLSAPQRWNRYGYALNNPGKYQDPDGENPLLISTAIGALTFGGWKAIQNVLNDRPVLEGVAEQTLAGAMVGATLGAAPATDRHPVRAVVMIDRVLRNPAQEKLYAEMSLTGRS